MTVGDVAAIVTIAVFVTAAATGLSTFLVHRRTASGKIGTSEASVLWQQAQDMRAMLQAEKDKAEQQRDRLIDSYTQQIVPALAATNSLVQNLTAAVTQALTMLREHRQAVEGGNQHGELGPQAPRPAVVRDEG